MKKIVSILLATLMLSCCFVIGTSAESADIEMSVKGSTGKPDDLVTFEVYLDKNAGTYGAGIDVFYDNMALSLVSVENGEVFAKSEYTSSPLNQVRNGKGAFRYYAETRDADGRNYKTGLMFKLTFQILKTAANGNYDINVEFVNGGDGWFFYKDPNSTGTKPKYIDLSCALTNKAAITVVGSDVPTPDTDDQGVIPATSEGETTKAPVTAYITDDSGKLVKGDDGKYETYVVPDNVLKDPVKRPPVYVFDEKGEPVTDEEGDYVTEPMLIGSETTDEDGNTAAPTTTAPTQSKEAEEKEDSAHRWILIASVAALAAAAVIVIVVVTLSRKNKKEEE